MGDIKKSLSHSFALFRWELNRTIKGGMWADPIEGGLTGAYSDYVQFFKKNSKLSTEAKARLSDRLKGLRNNVREMFAEDYYLWLFYEKQKIMKLNPVVRDMFYRYLPFKKDIRDELEKMPAFQDSAMRFKNIRTRVILGQTSKFRKYLDPVNGYPPEIQHYLDFLQM